jgi:hypothetical protein
MKAIFRLIFPLTTGMKALYTSVASSGGPAFWLKILTFKTLSNYVNIATLSHTYFNESEVLLLITNNKIVITSTACHFLQHYIPILLPTSIAMCDPHNIPYPIKYLL